MMYALIIEDKVLLFDMISHYGMHNAIDVNLEGYQIIKDYKKVFKHYEENYFDSVFNIEQYCDFLFRICVTYLKDLFL